MKDAIRYFDTGRVRTRRGSASLVVLTVAVLITV
jgi:hypothetical protein